MLKERMEYTDYNGNKRTEDFYFNLTEAELMEMELSTSGGLGDFIQRIIAEQDGKELVKIFKDLILKSVGKKSLDGKRFEKNDVIREEFAQTEAYSDLFMKLATDADAAARFVNGIMPSKYANAGNNVVSEIPTNQ
jgi:hypothetical protein